MATKAYKAALLDKSLKELEVALSHISVLTGIPAARIPAHDRDPEMLYAFRMEALAKWAQSAVNHLQMLAALTHPVKVTLSVDAQTLDKYTSDKNKASDEEPAPEKPTFETSAEYLGLEAEMAAAMDAAGEDTKKLNKVSADFTKKIQAAREKWLAANGDADG